MYQINYGILPENATNPGGVTWASNSTNVNVSETTGVINAVSQGMARITVTSNIGGFTDFVDITVNEPVVTIPRYNSTTGVLTVSAGTEITVRMTSGDVDGTGTARLTVRDSSGGSLLLAALPWDGQDGNIPSLATFTFTMPADGQAFLDGDHDADVGSANGDEPTGDVSIRITGGGTTNLELSSSRPTIP